MTPPKQSAKARVLEVYPDAHASRVVGDTEHVSVVRDRHALSKILGGGPDEDGAWANAAANLPRKGKP